MTDSQRTARFSFISHALLMLLVVAALVSVAISFAIRAANSEYKRDLRNWEIRLGTIANIRATAVEKWVNTQFSEMEVIAHNLSLRLYMTELMMDMEIQEVQQDAKAEVVFIRNFLTVMAERNGFFEPRKPNVKANVKPATNVGIALLDKQGKVLVASEGMPGLTEEDKQFVADAPKAKSAMRDIYKSKTGEPLIAFIVPVYAVQGEEVASDQIGYIYGIRKVQDSLYPLLEFPASIERTSETVLVRVVDGVAEYVSPLKDGTPPLMRTLTLDTPEYGVKFVVENPNQFAVKQNYAQNRVLVTGRLIEGTPWTLVHKISREEALAESDERRTRQVSISVLLILALVFLVVAVWRHGSSLRYKQLAEEFKSQENLLRLVTDNQPDAMYILDKDNTFRFTNLQAAEQREMDKESIIGKSVKDVIGSVKEEVYTSIQKEVERENTVLTRVQRREEKGGVKVIQAKFIPLARIPGVLKAGEISGMLVVEQDITSLILEREKRERTLAELVDSLVTLVDRRDSFSALQSIRVSIFATDIAREMDLDPVLIETTSVAGKLMNLGKIMLPRELLTKKDKLTPDEVRQINEAIRASADFVAGVEFDGPVVDTIRQSQENWDGSGPLGLHGKDILITAQIIAISNAFIAMTSPRAYRPSINRDQVIENFLGDVSKKYNRAVVAAVVNYLDNFKGRFEWEDYGSQGEPI